MFRRRRRKRRDSRIIPQEAAASYNNNEKDIVFVYRGKPKSIIRFIPKLFTSSSFNTTNDSNSNNNINSSSHNVVPRDIPHVTIHPSVRKIPENAFRDHECLERASIPCATVKKIGAHAFLQCQSLAQVDFGIVVPQQQQQQQDKHKNAATTTDTTTTHPKARAKTVGRLKKIGPGAFLNTLLVMVHLPEGLVEIGDFCFSGCTSLRKVSTVSSLKQIGSGAFLGCVLLTQIQFQEGLKQISPFCFSDCKALSVIALPESCKAIEARAFLYCTNLLGVEFLPSTKVKLGFECFYGCRNLANVHIPDSIESVARNAFDECDCLLEGGVGDSPPPFRILSRLRHRYESLPVHRTCYYSTGCTVDNLMQTLDNSCTLLEDDFGMTPYHVLATSANPRCDFLECLLETFSSSLLTRKDLSGKTMMDYLFLRIACDDDKAVPLIKLVLQRAVIDRISTWDHGRTWDLTPLVEAITTTEDDDDDNNNNNNIDARRFQVSDFYKKAGYCAMVETRTLLELATWKMRLKAVVVPKQDDSETSDDNYRASCQYQCGAGQVIENVSGYLWDATQAKAETAKSTFRLFHAVDPGMDDSEIRA